MIKILLTDIVYDYLASIIPQKRRPGPVLPG